MKIENLGVVKNKMNTGSILKKSKNYITKNITITEYNVMVYNLAKYNII